jgi:hypothetical protein
VVVVEAVMVAAGVVSALAALGALWFARDTVRETRALRREERLARVPELISEVADAARRVRYHHSEAWELGVAQSRLRAAVAAAGEPLPHSSALVDPERLDPHNANSVLAEVNAAFTEITERLTHAPG